MSVYKVVELVGCDRASSSSRSDSPAPRSCSARADTPAEPSAVLDSSNHLATAVHPDVESGSETRLGGTLGSEHATV